MLLSCAVLFAMVGCSSTGAGSAGTVASPGSTDASVSVGAHMSGAATEVVVSQAAVASRPAPWSLTSPESAVRSYLAWTSYGYRTATSAIASPTMGPEESVRVDAYVQLNLEKGRLIDQALTSISFGKTSVEGTQTLVPTKEKWTYSYISIKAPGGTVLAGPYPASYDATYTVVESGGSWRVYAVTAKALGTVK
jgi:hypothetical protein